MSDDDRLLSVYRVLAVMGLVTVISFLLALSVVTIIAMLA